MDKLCGYCVYHSDFVKHKLLVQFSTTLTQEVGFSTRTNFKTLQQNILKMLNNEIQEFLSNILQNIQEMSSSHLIRITH